MWDIKSILGQNIFINDGAPTFLALYKMWVGFFLTLHANIWVIWPLLEERKEKFHLMTHSTHFYLEILGIGHNGKARLR